VIIRVADAVIGEILRLESHPAADKIWLAYVRTSRHEEPVQIVFGGTRHLEPGDLVAVAPPGVRITLRGLRKPKRIRARNYRGKRSNGMLCSLNELGWAVGGPDEVAVFHDLIPGFKLDEVPFERRSKVVVRWDQVIDQVDTITIAAVAPTTDDVDVAADPVVLGVIMEADYIPSRTSGRIPA
jgi:tRNA-binding EMAP/Myf-like protein